MTDATPLQVRSGYSMLWSAAMPDRLTARAAELGHRRLALTDVNGLYGATVFWKAAVAAGLQPLVGAELQEDGLSAVVLIDSQLGYENLCRLLTGVHQRKVQSGAMFPRCRGKHASGNERQSMSPLISDALELAEGLQWIVEDAATAEAMLAAGMGRDRLWLGVDPAVQAPMQLRELAECAQRFDLPLTATGKALLCEPQDAEVARLLAAIRLGATIDNLPAEALPHPKAFLRPADRLAMDASGICDAAVTNNRRLADRCAAFQLLPRRPVFPRFPCPGARPATQYLRQLCREGMRRRYGAEKRRKELAEIRLERELRLIERLGFSEYFLVVWDIVQYARRRGAPVAGRGSGASSLVAYVLGITNVCPVACGIPFERFLHEGREDFPDLDVDFCWRIRDDVIDYAFRRWDGGRAAMVCVHNAFQARSALRETAKAFGFSEDQISGRREMEADGRLAKIAALSRRLIGLPHNLSVHPGGIVITPRPIDHYAPIEMAAKGVPITQYDKDGVEDVRLVKLDLLGNRNLSTIRTACELISEQTGRRLDPEALPADDAETLSLLRRADTVGCNQLESPAMRHLLRMMQPRAASDLMRVLALIRPGAASIGMKETFIRRLRGLELVPRGHEQVDAILAGTFGVMTYEDDVMLVAAALLGEDLVAADRFRKAVQKCRDDEDRLRLSREFLDRCRQAGVEIEYAKSLWVQMAKFNAYSFCRAHAASYGMLAYAGAYLKTHHPREFWAAALNNNQSMYHPRVYVEHAKRDGVRFLLPDVNGSHAEFAVDAAGGGALRVGLSRVDGLGPVAVATILEERKRRLFAGLTDFMDRTGLGEVEARSLILCGAMDGVGRSRPTLMIELGIYPGTRSGRGVRGGALLPAGPVVPDAPRDYSPRRKYADERRILGVSVGEHPMVWLREALSGRTDCDSRHVADRVGRRVRLAGLVEAQRTARTASGGDMMFLTMDDPYGLFEVTVFPDLVRSRRLGGAAVGYGPYVVTGVVEDQYGAVTVRAEEISEVAADDPEDSEVLFIV